MRLGTSADRREYMDLDGCNAWLCPDATRHQRTGPDTVVLPAEDRPHAGLPPSQAWKRRKMATAFCPPKPKPLIIAVSTRVLRATRGT